MRALARASGLFALGMGALASPSPGAAQERCDLRITAPTRSSVGAPGGGGAYTTYLGGGTVTLRCGGATMTGDSAVHFESEERAVMIGDVAYGDTTRTLSAERLTYFERSGRVLATGDVELVRLSTGARLEGPRVGFFRAGAGAGVGRTLATDRPHMTIPPQGGEGPPVEVDADEAEFLGDTIATARGEVVILRTDFDATADSARFAGELGRLYGRPVVSARGMRLTGDSLHVETASGGGVETVHAFGAARGEGESVDLEAEEIVVAFDGNEVERIEGFGGDRAVAGTGAFVMAGEALDVRFAAGAPDSLTAVGEARAYQMEEAREAGAPLAEPAADVGGRTSWIQGDSLRAWLEPAPAAAAGEAAREARLRRLFALGAARSYFAAVRDTAASDRPSRNYIIGESIDIAFARGEPELVTAEQAIGVFLEPTDGAPPGRETPAAGGATP